MATSSPAATDYASLRERHLDNVPCEWVESITPAISQYTPAPPARGCAARYYAVALAASMKHNLLRQSGRGGFPPPTSAGWWATSYIVYGPLIGGMATVVYEGLPIRPDPHLVADCREVQGR